MTEPLHRTYEDGLRDGEIRGLIETVKDHKGRLDNHSNRLRILERVVWGFFAIVAFIEFWPKLQSLIGQ